MKDEPIVSTRTRRAFHIAVWAGRALGAILFLIAVGGIVEQFSAGKAVAFRVFSAVVLAVVAIAWILCLEVFLRFFDRYLSRN